MTGVEEDAVAFADRSDALPLDHCLHVLISDDAGIGFDAGTFFRHHCRDRQLFHAAIGSRVQQYAATNETFLGNVFDTQWSDTVRPGHLSQDLSVVEEITPGGADADVTRAVELGSDLADLGRHYFVVAN